MDQNTFVLLYCVFYEVKYSLSSSVFLIEDNLILDIKPLEGEVDYSSSLEVVLDLLARAVDNVSNLVGHHKLLVLHKQP